MEIRYSTASLLFQASPSSPPSPNHRRRCPEARQSSAGSCGQSPGGGSEGSDAVEQSDLDQQDKAQVYEEERRSKEAESDGDREQPVAEEAESVDTEVEDEELTGFPEEGACSRPVGSRLPEAASAGNIGRGDRLYSSSGDASSGHDCLDSIAFRSLLLLLFFLLLLFQLC